MDAVDEKTLVWDLPTRVFHWLLVTCFAGAYITGEGERWRDVHAMLGYTAGGLIVFRLLWGLIGTRYARFASFALAPGAVGEYLRSLLSFSPRRHWGHNPAGSWAIVLLLALVLGAAVSGWPVYVERGPQWFEEVHEALANAALAVVFMHVAGVAFSSLLHRENLVRAMVTGYKPGHGPAAAGRRTIVALLLLGAVGAFWAGVIPAPGLAPGTNLSQAAAQRQAQDGSHDRQRRRERDDD